MKLTWTKRCCFMVLSACLSMGTAAQNSDDLYRVPLEEVLRRIEDKFGIEIRHNEKQVAGKMLTYGHWRLREDVESSLDNVLAPFDMVAVKEKGSTYKLKDFEYHRWPMAEGWKRLHRIAAQYDDRSSWEHRKDTLRQGLLEALQLHPLPPSPGTPPITTPRRYMKGYTVENIAIEILPGLYVNGSIYRPSESVGKMPLVLSPDGHWPGHRYREDAQLRFGSIARMGAMAISYDLFAWGESLLQFKPEDHRRSLAHTLQTLAGIRMLDYVFTDLPEVDISRIGISGGSGGGSHTTLMTALDDRITLCAPVVSLSSYHFGGCPCESGMPIHFVAGGTNNVELAAMAAPRPQLLVSDGADWTAQMGMHDYPYLQKIYGYYQLPQLVEHIHLPEEGHDFGISKRRALYAFLIKHFQLDTDGTGFRDGWPDEAEITIEPEEALRVFGDEGGQLPSNAIMGFEQLENLFTELRKHITP